MPAQGQTSGLPSQFAKNGNKYAAKVFSTTKSPLNFATYSIQTLLVVEFSIN